MLINGKDRNFAYTIGAYVDINDLKLGKGTSKADVDKIYVYTALAMQKASEDIKKIADKEYKPDYMTLEEVRSLEKYRLEELKAEVDKAYTRDSKIEVKTQPKKEAKGKN